jgi:Lamin Tail Domain
MRPISSNGSMSRSATKHTSRHANARLSKASRRLRLRALIMLLCLSSATALYCILAPQPAAAFSNTIVISQIYGGGGNTGAQYTHDFIELYNRGTTTVSLTGWSLQYANATGTSWTVKTLSGSIAPGKYYLVRQGTAGATNNLPAADATGGPAMGNTAGKVALVSTTTTLDGTSGCPFRADIVDFVGYGNSGSGNIANCSETSQVPNLSNTTAAIRKGHSGNAYQETDNNSADFSVAAPMPRNGASSGTTGSQVLISEFRLRGPNGENDEFIKIYNNTDSDITVTDNNPVTCAAQVINPLDTLVNCGWAIVDTLGAVTTPAIPRVVIPVGQTIPARGHYLIVNNGTGGYSLSSYATSNLTYSPPAYGDGDYTGLALFKTADRAQFNTTNLYDAVGFYGINTSSGLYREGNGLSSTTGISANGQYSFVRKIPVATANAQDTGDNAADFVFVATDGGTYSGMLALLGAPGPQNSTGPVKRNITDTSPGFITGLVDPNRTLAQSPHQVRENTNFGSTVKIRRKYTNNTGGTISQFRFRIIDLTTLNAPNLYSGATQLDLRAVTSDTETISLVAGGTQDVQGFTLEYADGATQPDQSTNGGGVNSSLAAGTLSGGTFTLSTPLAQGDSIYVNLWFRVAAPLTGSGKFRFALIIEAQ